MKPASGEKALENKEKRELSWASVSVKVNKTTGLFTRISTLKSRGSSTTSSNQKALQTPCGRLSSHSGPLLPTLVFLVAPYRPILGYYRCDTPYRTIPFQGGSCFPEMVRHPPWYLASHRHICAIPHLPTYHSIIVWYPMKTRRKSSAILSPKASCDMESIAAWPLLWSCSWCIHWA